MSNDCTEIYDNTDKWILAVIIALMASVVFSPFFFSIINAGTMSFGVRFATEAGLPTLAGLLLHTIVFFFLVRLVLL